jgi:chromosome condensin MukBEF complex kleisin-like MukF subunit
MRSAARGTDLSVRRLARRGEGSHTLWVLYDAHDKELSRTTIPDHAGDLSLRVTRSIEQAFESWFGKGWLG